MIGVIGNEDEVIGFGLGGLDKMTIVQEPITKEELLKAVSELDVEALVIPARLANIIREDTTCFLIEIPEGMLGTKRIAALTKQLLGVDII